MEIAPYDKPVLKIRAEGATSSRSFEVQTNGDMFQKGDFGLRASTIHAIENGKETYFQTALEVWEKTIETSRELLAIDQGPTRAIAANAISRLVTGFEVYCKRRFMELPGEGKALDASAVVRKFRADQRIDHKKRKATPKNRGFEDGDLRIVDMAIQQGIINFQSYHQASSAFTAGYGIRFSELQGSAPLITVVTQSMAFRHRFTHAKPDTILFKERDTTGPHIELTPTLALEKLGDFERFIFVIHAATIKQ